MIAGDVDPMRREIEAVARFPGLQWTRVLRPMMDGSPVGGDAALQSQTAM
jgi:hypothetical protein